MSVSCFRVLWIQMPEWDRWTVREFWEKVAAPPWTVAFQGGLPCPSERRSWAVKLARGP